MVIEGLKLTILGMGMVFIFLVLLVTFIQISSSILASTTKQELKTLEGELSNSSSAKQNENNQSTLIAVITAAINTYRKHNQI